LHKEEHVSQHIIWKAHIILTESTTVQPQTKFDKNGKSASS
jgi:hypothetical protein